VNESVGYFSAATSFFSESRKVKRTSAAGFAASSMVAS
jgi:hypothetical protein